MKIATNIHRDAFGGITISNLALFDWLLHTSDTIVGIEIVSERHIMGTTIFKRYLPSFFSHHIVNGLDVLPKYSWEKIGNPRKKWHVLVQETKNVLKMEAPDVVLINGTYNVPWILAVAASELGIPIVLRYAGVLQKEITHKHWLIRRRLKAHEKWLASVANTVIFPSRICQEVVEKDILGCSAKHSVIIPNPAERYKTNLRRRSGRYTIAAIGRWTPIKNFEAFIGLHNKLLNEEWPHKAIMITSFWDERFGIPDTIERIDSMGHEDLLGFYKKIDLLVVMSHFETFCNVAAEALLSGTSVLVSKQVGFADILLKAGLKRMVIESTDDPLIISKAVKRIAKTELSKKETQKVASLLDPQYIHRDIINVLKGVLRGV